MRKAATKARKVGTLLVITGLCIAVITLCFKVINLKDQQVKNSEQRAELLSNLRKKEDVANRALSLLQESERDNQELLNAFGSAKVAAIVKPTDTRIAEIRTVDMMDMLTRARELMARGDHASSLQALLVCFDQGRNVPTFRGPRLSAVLMDLAKLAEVYPEAKNALLERRALATKATMGDPREVDALAELVALNRTLKEEHVTVGIYDQLATDDPRRDLIARGAYNTFVEMQRYADAFNGRDEAAMFQTFNTMIKLSTRLDGAGREKALNAGLGIAAKNVEVLWGVGKSGAAASLASKMLQTESPGLAYELLTRAAERTGMQGALAAMPTKR